jgi:hypothetical protein
VVDLYDPASRQPVLDEKGKPKKALLQPSTLANPNPAAPWYRGTGRDGTDLTHAWFIGFAPAEEPQIAFAVMVEYGGGGGGAAATLAKDVIDLCIRHRHLTVPGTAPKQPQGVAGGGAELLRPIAAATSAPQ